MLIVDVQVAGLREALDMKGHDYNTVLSVTTAGSVNQKFPNRRIQHFSRADQNNQNGYRPDSSRTDYTKDQAAHLASIDGRRLDSFNSKFD